MIGNGGVQDENVEKEEEPSSSSNPPANNQVVEAADTPAEEDVELGPHDEGFRRKILEPSLPEHYAQVPVTSDSNKWCCAKLGNFTGVGFIISVGYMDPGNWATDVAGGAQFGYDLLTVVLMASLAAMVLQYLSLKLGVATGRDLAQAMRDSYHPYVVKFLWVIIEIAMIATDMAEVLGAAIALYLLTGLALPIGVAITALDVFLILFLQQNRLRAFEVIIFVLVLVIFICLLIVVVMANPDWAAVFRGLVPTGEIFTNPDELFVAIGILGATVMPHNLFLHSSLVQSRKYPRTVKGKKFAVRWASLDSNLSLCVAFCVNSLILILAASAFHGVYSDTADILDAYKLLTPALGTQTASILFGVALLASGQQASLTGTLAGQIVMEGMIDFHIAPWKRRVVTRGIAIIPSIIVTSIMGEQSAKLLVVSQVILSISLSFATFPLLMFTSDVKKMGKEFVNSKFTMLIGGIIVLIIAGLNIYLLTTLGSLDF